MANNQGFGIHPRGVRLDNITHACPECGIGVPKAFCPVCLGAGTVSEARLGQWIREQNDKNR